MVPPVCCGLVALELGALALGCGLHADFAVFREERADSLLRFPMEPVRELAPVGAVDGLLRRLDGEGAVGGDLGGQLGRPRAELARGVDVVDEAEAERLRRVEAAGGVDQPLGPAGPAGARGPPGAAPVPGDGAVGFWGGEGPPPGR